MPRRPPVGAARTACALGLLLLTGCSTSGGTAAPQGVPVSPINGLPTSTLVACRDFQATLPEALGPDLSRVPVVPASNTTNGFGDPLVAVRCGVGPGSDRDELFTINDVRWAAHDTGASRTWTTLGRKVNVEIVIPDAYAQQAEIVGSVAKAVAKVL